MWKISGVVLMSAICCGFMLSMRQGIRLLACNALVVSCTPLQHVPTPSWLGLISGAAPAGAVQHALQELCMQASTDSTGLHDTEKSPPAVKDAG